LTGALGGTGWWLLAGREGEPSYLARAVGVSDISLHKALGWALAALGGLAIVFGGRAVVTFVRDSFRREPGDARWLLSWPLATFTGRFRRHDGHFDPGQRIANVILAGGLIALVVSGIGLVLVHGGPSFVWLLKVHKYATHVLTVVVAGHIAIASGIFPGYRGVARSMHFGGRIKEGVSRRLWPGWTERTITAEEAGSPTSPRRD
jgi:cytochrome b subunit of formate dehydrogenase